MREWLWRLRSMWGRDDRAGERREVCLLAIPVASTWWRALTAGLPPLDAWAWIGTPTALLAITIIASLGPARTAARQVDGTALRED